MSNFEEVALAKLEKYNFKSAFEWKHLVQPKKEEI